MRDCYIPDLTERYPEGFRGVDMFEPFDIEAKMWDDLEREYRESERANIEHITRKGYKVIKQDATGFTFAECEGDLILCTIRGGEIVSLEDIARDNPANRQYISDLFDERTESN